MSDCKTVTPEETLAALKKSIAHWERIVADPLGEKIGVKDCALCGLFRNFGIWDAPKCEGCPVMNATGAPRCEGTPYDNFANAFENEEVGVSELSRLANAELDFLRSLLPREVDRDLDSKSGHSDPNAGSEEASGRRKAAEYAD